MPRKSSSGGRPEITIKDIAARLGLSHATVSRALNDHPATSDAAKARVRAAAEALGYVRNANAGSLSGAASRLVGFVTPDVHSEFYAAIASVLATSCAAAGLQLVLAVSNDDPQLEQRHILALRQARAAGVFITPTADLLDASAALLAPLPTVQLVRSHKVLGKPWVGIDDRIGVGLATRHLLELGHRRIGFIGGFEALTTGHERRSGYQQALAEAGVIYDETLVVLGPPRASFGLEATVHLTQKADPVTALVLGSSQLTLGALRAFQQLGATAPEDFSVVGYSDPEWVRIWGPGLTTIGLPVEDIAASAAQVLIRAMTNPPWTAPSGRGGVFFQPHLIERGSTAPP
jgi:LacI family transcriptional regulator